MNGGDTRRSCPIQCDRRNSRPRNQRRPDGGENESRPARTGKPHTAHDSMLGGDSTVLNTDRTRLRKRSTNKQRFRGGYITPSTSTIPSMSPERKEGVLNFTLPIIRKSIKGTGSGIAAPPIQNTNSTASYVGEWSEWLGRRNNRKGTVELLGCSVPHLKAHLERQWEPGMSWENYGKGAGKWNVDHIRPCASFNLRDQEQANQCFHFSNLRPMWHEDNSSKKSFYEGKHWLRNGHPRYSDSICATPVKA